MLDLFSLLSLKRDLRFILAENMLDLLSLLACQEFEDLFFIEPHCRLNPFLLRLKSLKKNLIEPFWIYTNSCTLYTCGGKNCLYVSQMKSYTCIFNQFACKHTPHCHEHKKKD